MTPRLIDVTEARAFFAHATQRKGLASLDDLPPVEPAARSARRTAAPRRNPPLPPPARGRQFFSTRQRPPTLRSRLQKACASVFEE